MKTALIFIMLATCLQGVAQLGIGTASPNGSAILDMTSTSRGMLAPRMTAAQRQAISNPATGLMVYQTDIQANSSNTPGFYVYDGSGWRRIAQSDELMPAATSWTVSGINQYNSLSGNIGLGTTNPSQKLHIFGGKIYLQDNRPGNSPHVIFDIPAVDFKQGGLQWTRSGDTLASLNYVANPSVSNYLQWNAGGNISAYYNAAGNFGIGVVEPASRMHLRNATGTELLRLDGDNPSIRFMRNTGGNIPSWTEVGFVQTTDTRDLRIGTYSGNTGGRFVVRTNGADRLLVDGAGVVNIGTTKKAGGYLLNVGGRVICEEVRVQVESAWPDYVFDSAYSLRSIYDLDAYIKQYRHLPNVTPASLVAEEGVAIGDMQRQLLEKIEELTLYVISLQKQVDTLRRK